MDPLIIKIYYWWTQARIKVLVGPRHFSQIAQQNFFWGYITRVDYNLEYENLEKFNLEFILISNFSATSISKKKRR